MLENVLDIALLLVSGSACLYCWILSRRLRALQDLRRGLGASIVSLSEAISKTSVAAQEARVSAAQSADKLTRLLADIDRSVPVVDDLIESVNRSTRRAANETTRMQDEAVATIRPLLEDAKKTAVDLATILELIQRNKTDLLARAIDERAALTDEEDEIATVETFDAPPPAAEKAAPGRTAASKPAAPGTGQAGEAEKNPFRDHALRLQAIAEARRAARTGAESDTSGKPGPAATKRRA